MERWDTLWPGGWTFCFGDGAFKPSTDSFLLGGFPPLRRGWRVCDLGAGTGLLGLLLLAREPALTVTGLELSPAACRKDGRTGLTVQPPLLLQNADGTETEELRRIYFKDKG